MAQRGQTYPPRPIDAPPRDTVDAALTMAANPYLTDAEWLARVQRTGRVQHAVTSYTGCDE